MTALIGRLGRTAAKSACETTQSNRPDFHVNPTPGNLAENLSPAGLPGSIAHGNWNAFLIGISTIPAEVLPTFHHSKGAVPARKRRLRGAGRWDRKTDRGALSQSRSGLHLC